MTNLSLPTPVTGISWLYAHFMDEPGFQKVTEISRDAKNQIIYLRSAIKNNYE
ncbi:MAG: hypothetical protein ACTHKY_18825 [Ginsengibacter sp.]|jgi:hypothetical protein